MSGEDLSTQPIPDRTQPISATEMIQLGRQYLSSGRVREADALFQRALSGHPRNAEAWYGRGLVAAIQAHHEEAAACFRKAISCKHTLLSARIDLANSLLVMDRLDEALAAAQTATRLGADSSMAHVVLGNILCELGDAAEGLAALRRAVDLEPTQAEPHFRVGLAYQQLGQFEEAVGALEHAAEIAPKRAEVVYSLGTVRHALHHLDDALDAYNRALALRPSLAEHLFAIGRPRHIHALMENKDLAGALNRLDAFLERLPGQSCALALKAIVLDELGQRDEVRRLVDFRTLISTIRLSPANEIADLNSRLAEHILGHPTLRGASAASSLHRGRSTGDLLAPPLGPIREFEAHIRKAVDTYKRSLSAEPTHPFLQTAHNIGRFLCGQMSLNLTGSKFHIFIRPVGSAQSTM
jgi:tetratricopeptide (TPR) repeat protein